jgi:hypothetical protein
LTNQRGPGSGLGSEGYERDLRLDSASSFVSMAPRVRRGVA